jgi:hypothetical protein
MLLGGMRPFVLRPERDNTFMPVGISYFPRNWSVEMTQEGNEMNWDNGGSTSDIVLI